MQNSENKESKTDILVVTSKVKKYVKNRNGLATSSAAINVLSDRIEAMLDAAMQRALTDGRKTIMERDL